MVCSASDDVVWIALLNDPVVECSDYDAGMVRLGVKDTRISTLTVVFFVVSRITSNRVMHLNRMLT